MKLSLSNKKITLSRSYWTFSFSILKLITPFVKKTENKNYCLATHLNILNHLTHIDSKNSHSVNLVSIEMSFFVVVYTSSFIDLLNVYLLDKLI